MNISPLWDTLVDASTIALLAKPEGTIDPGNDIDSEDKHQRVYGARVSIPIFVISPYKRGPVLAKFPVESNFDGRLYR